MWHSRRFAQLKRRVRNSNDVTDEVIVCVCVRARARACVCVCGVCACARARAIVYNCRVPTTLLTNNCSRQCQKTNRERLKDTMKFHRMTRDRYGLSLCRSCYFDWEYSDRRTTFPAIKRQDRLLFRFRPALVEYGHWQQEATVGDRLALNKAANGQMVTRDRRVLGSASHQPIPHFS
jgi:hypothetical protein